MWAVGSVLLFCFVYKPNKLLERKEERKEEDDGSEDGEIMKGLWRFF